MPDAMRRFAALLLALAANAASASEESGPGERIFRSRCQQCHTVQAGEGNATGPNLHGVTRRGQAMLADYDYSEALLKERGESWSDERLERFLQSPRKFAPGTRMLFPGLVSADERRAVLRFLGRED